MYLGRLNKGQVSGKANKGQVPCIYCEWEGRTRAKFHVFTVSGKAEQARPSSVYLLRVGRQNKGQVPCIYCEWEGRTNKGQVPCIYCEWEGRTRARFHVFTVSGKAEQGPGSMYLL